MGKQNLFGNGKLRYYIAESFVLASLVSHGVNEIFGIDNLLGIDKCPKEVFSCALNGALIGYILGGSIDLTNHITNYIVKYNYSIMQKKDTIKGLENRVNN